MIKVKYSLRKSGIILWLFLIIIFLIIALKSIAFVREKLVFTTPLTKTDDLFIVYREDSNPIQMLAGVGRLIYRINSNGKCVQKGELNARYDQICDVNLTSQQLPEGGIKLRCDILRITWDLRPNLKGGYDVSTKAEIWDSNE